MPTEPIDIEDDFATIVRRVRAEIIAAGEDKAPTIGGYASPITAPEREALMRLLRDGTYHRAAARVALDDTDLADQWLHDQRLMVLVADDALLLTVLAGDPSAELAGDTTRGELFTIESWYYRVARASHDASFGGALSSSIDALSPALRGRAIAALVRCLEVGLLGMRRLVPVMRRLDVGAPQLPNGRSCRDRSPVTSCASANYAVRASRRRVRGARDRPAAHSV